MKIKIYRPFFRYGIRVVVRKGTRRFLSLGCRYFDGDWTGRLCEYTYLNDKERRSLRTIFNFGDE